MSRDQYETLAVEAANKYGIPVDLFLRQIQQESGWNPNALSSAGAQGIMQFMPGTASDMGIDPSDPTQAIDAGARYLRQQYDEFGDWGLAAAAYNSGPGNVRKYGGIPPFEETRNYVAKLTGSGGSDYGAPSGNALSGSPQGGQSRPDPNALAALLEPKKPEVPQLWQGHDPAMFQNRGRFA